jgi:hypothetical protein
MVRVRTRSRTFPIVFRLIVDNGGIHGTISASLQYASLMSLGTGYANSNLHNGWWFYNTIDMGQGSVGWWFNTMRVFGNAGIVLP